MDLIRLKKLACDAIDEYSDKLNEISQKIWKKPELALEEFYAHDLLCNFFEEEGFDVERKLVLDTAFRATFGKADDRNLPHVGVMCEYDALPGIGHACGHNLIAEVGVATSIGIMKAMQSVEQPFGKLSVFGTPAEEGYGGKVDMIRKNIFCGLQASVMAHPWSFSSPKLTVLNRQNVKALFKGKAAHASASPWEGVNALDAAVTAYTSISNLRQQIKPSWRMHGIFSKGGDRPNIIPEVAELEYYVRAPTMKEVDILKSKIEDCFKGAALTSGCTVEIEWNPNPYENLISNDLLVERYVQNSDPFDMNFCTDEKKISTAAGSTDMGNVSHIVPSIHPMFYIGTDAVNHTRDFATASGEPIAQKYTLDVAKSLAMTALDVYLEPQLSTKIKEKFDEDIKVDSL